MVSPKLGYLTQSIRSKYGLDFRFSYSEDNGKPTLVLYPVGIGDVEGFRIVLQLDWRSFEGKLIFGDFAGDLVRSMGKHSIDKGELFRTYAQIINRDNGQLQIFINNKEYDENFSRWPRKWSRFDLKVQIKYVVIDKDDISQITSFFDKWSGRFVGLFASILPIEEKQNEEFLDEIATDAKLLPEGAKARVEINRYERSYLNRQACIDYYGFQCQVCGLIFENEYDSIGKDFIHVHHIIPLANLGKEYLLNPITDLIPLCPNCHSMIHRQNPPFSVEELKAYRKKGTA